MLRVSAPLFFLIPHLGRLFAEFLRRHPDFQLDLSLSDRFVDPVQDGMDIVLRIIRQLPDSTLIARKLANIDTNVNGFENEDCYLANSLRLTTY